MLNVLIWIVVLLVVAAIVRWQWNFILGFWQDGGRGQFLVMGMPAVIFFVLGVTALGLAAVNMDRLDVQYENLALRANEEAKRIRDEIRKNRAVVGSTQPGSKSVIPDEQLELLRGEENKERIFLEKLVGLDNDNPEHKYKLALLAFNQGDPQRGLNLMQLVAPFNEPGYPKAHLFLAQYFLGQRTGSSDDQKRINRERALKQIDNCLVADESNLDAKRIKAYILEQKRQYLQSYEIYKELFSEDPIHYKDLLRLATTLGKTADRQSFLSQASTKYRQMTNKSSDNVSEWVDAWTNYVDCMKKQGTVKSLTDAETSLKGELRKFNDDIGKKVFLKEQLSTIYSDRASLHGRDAPLNVKKQQLSDLAKAIENNRKNDTALQWITVLGNSSEIGDEAKKIYDPNFDPNTPWVVLSEQGHHALRQKDFENAITFFERARKKNPREPLVLNNLAFAYLSAKNRNPEQALLLIDQAINILIKTKQGNRTELVSSFFDTRGVALMQLDRWEEAAAAFEIAFRNRPNSANIISQLITCYKELGNDRQAEAYRRRLEKLNKEESDSK